MRYPGLSEIVAALTKWGPERGFAMESLAAVYVIYRFLSSIAAHHRRRGATAPPLVVRWASQGALLPGGAATAAVPGAACGQCA
ncbi:hypothetical protein ABIA33_002444 [Streptacidiphilus sp. MAP12-16]